MRAIELALVGSVFVLALGCDAGRPDPPRATAASHAKVEPTRRRGCC